MPHINAPPPPPEAPKRKDERMEIRIDAELAARARQKAEARGWTLGSVMRALLSLWTDEDVVSAEDVGQQIKRVKKRKPKGE